MFPLQVSSQFVSIPLSQNMCSSKEAGLKRDDFLFLKAMNICKWSKRENFCPKFPNYFPSNIPNQLHEVTSTTNKTTRFNILQKNNKTARATFFQNHYDSVKCLDFNALTTGFPYLLPWEIHPQDTNEIQPTSLSLAASGLICDEMLWVQFRSQLLMLQAQNQK